MVLSKLSPTSMYHDGIGDDGGRAWSAVSVGSIKILGEGGMMIHVQYMERRDGGTGGDIHSASTVNSWNKNYIIGCMHLVPNTYRIRIIKHKHHAF